MADDYMLCEVLNKIKIIITIQKFDNTNILIDTDDKLAREVALKNPLILNSYVIKDGDKFYPQVFLKKPLVAEELAMLVKCWYRVGKCR